MAYGLKASSCHPLMDRNLTCLYCKSIFINTLLFLPSSDIDQLITISGMVIRTSGLMPEMREAFFRCYVCSATVAVEIDRGRIAEPAICRNCQTKHSMGLIHNRSQFSDKQMVKLQESPGECCHTVGSF